MNYDIQVAGLRQGKSRIHLTDIDTWSEYGMTIFCGHHVDIMQGYPDEYKEKTIEEKVKYFESQGYQVCKNCKKQIEEMNNNC